MQTNMALFNFSNKDANITKTAKAKKPKKSVRSLVVSPAGPKNKKPVPMYGIIRAPVVSEKSSMLMANRKYTFVVGERANKIDIKRSIASMYGVTVTNVAVAHIPGKEIRRGKHTGWRPGHKKAIVTIKEGQSIELS